MDLGSNWIEETKWVCGHVGQRHEMFAACVKGSSSREVRGVGGVIVMRSARHARECMMTESALYLATGVFCAAWGVCSMRRGVMLGARCHSTGLEVLAPRPLLRIIGIKNTWRLDFEWKHSIVWIPAERKMVHLEMTQSLLKVQKLLLSHLKSTKKSLLKITTTRVASSLAFKTFARNVY